MCLFVRGSSEAMFENVYALQSLISKNIGETVANQVSEAFGIDQIATIQALRQYGMAGFIQASYLSNVSAGSQNNFKIYYDEFGTIMRECAYFNIRYDKAYPALIAELVPISNGERGYTVSAFKAGSYGAEFLIFNNTDKTITLDEKTGNFLRIMGVTFTQNTSYELSVDDYFKERANFSDPLVINGVIQPPEIAEQTYNTIKTSRQRNGKREFSINPLFIQNEEMASELMEWFVDKTLRERKSFTMTVFGVPQLQLGDIVNIDFTMPEGVAFVDKTKQFVVSSINYARSMESLEASIKVIEV
jgi:hypothetical protein